MIEPITVGIRDGFMVGLPVRVTEGLAVGVRVSEGLAVGVRVSEGLAVGVRVTFGMPVRVVVGLGVVVGVGVGALGAAKAPVVPPESSATDRTPAPSARP
ncbi:hypothetical protein ACWC2T_00790 [Streptomyces sp. NPDC001393]